MHFHVETKRPALEVCMALRNCYLLSVWVFIVFLMATSWKNCQRASAPTRKVSAGRSSQALTAIFPRTPAFNDAIFNCTKTIKNEGFK